MKKIHVAVVMAVTSTFEVEVEDNGNGTATYSTRPIHPIDIIPLSITSDVDGFPKDLKEGAVIAAHKTLAAAIGSKWKPEDSRKVISSEPITDAVN